MYVCLCRALTSDQIKQATQQGARCNRDLNGLMGAPDCGQCGADTREIIQQTIACIEPNTRFSLPA